MAFSRNSSSRILIIFVSCLVFDVLFSSSKLFLATADLIDDICAQTTIDPEFCKKAFRSDPRSAKADLQTLAQIGIDLAQSNTQSTVTLVKSLEKKATDPKLKGIYDSCLENYNDTSDNLKDCTSALKQKDYPTLNIRASAALDGPVTCDDNFSEPPSEPGQLKESSKQIQELCAAISAIANKLQGQIY